MASSNLKGTYKDKNGELRPSAATAREQLRRQKGYEADSSFDETFNYFGYDNTSAYDILNNSARLENNNQKADVGNIKNSVIDKIASGENEYYKNAQDLVKPEYEGQYDSQINNLVNKILSGKKFSYDINGDSLYQQYKNQYERNAKKSAENTMNDAMSASGGYSNSYAQAVADQAYNSEMQNLGDKIPDFESQAYNRYSDERSEDYNKLSMLMNRENIDYGKYRDDVSGFYNEREYELGMGDRYADDLYKQANLYQNIEDSEFNKQMSLDEFAFNKEQYANDLEYQKAAAAADMGNFNLMGDYLGIDSNKAAQWYEIQKGMEIYSATGMVKALEDAGLNVSELRENIKNDEYEKNLTYALSIYDATGDATKLNKLGVKTDYMDEINKYTLLAAKKNASSSSGSGGSGTSKSTSTSVTEESFTSGDTSYTCSQLTEYAYHLYYEHPDWKVNSSTVDSWLDGSCFRSDEDSEIPSITGQAKSKIKEILKELGMESSIRG